MNIAAADVECNKLPVTNRPLKHEDSLWPTDARLQIVSGIDLLKGSQKDLEATIKDQVKDVEKITHLYYLGKANPFFFLFSISN